MQTAAADIQDVDNFLLILCSTSNVMVKSIDNAILEAKNLPICTNGMHSYIAQS